MTTTAQPVLDSDAPAGMARRAVVARALRLEWLTVAWNALEGALALVAALAAGSVALLAFGIDSLVEGASGGILIWRLRAERGGAGAEAVERLDRRARRLVALSLYGLALYVGVDAVLTLWHRERPSASLLGMAVTALSLGVMVWLARAKRRAAAELGSGALAADAVQTMACWRLSVVTLAGIALNAAFGWWWADPAAALGVTFLLVREGGEAWRGEPCC